MVSLELNEVLPYKLTQFSKRIRSYYYFKSLEMLINKVNFGQGYIYTYNPRDGIIVRDCLLKLDTKLSYELNSCSFKS